MYDEMNATISGMNGLSTFTDFGAIWIVGTVFIAALCILILLTNKTTMRWLIAIANFLKLTLGNFFIGLLTLIVIIPIGWFINLNAKQVQAGNPIILKCVAVAIAVYFTVSLIGWIVRIMFGNVKKTYEIVKKNQRKA